MTGGHPPGYRPGVCNIGATERRRRYRYAAVAAAAAVAYAAVVLAWSVPTALLLGLFVPFALGLEFLLQARRSFCASLGFRGRFDLRGDGGSEGLDSVAADGRGAGHDRTDRRDDAPDATDPDATGRVTDPDARTADRRYALRLTLLGVFGGGVGAVLVYGAAVLFG
jgi:hypothetical protein